MTELCVCVWSWENFWPISWIHFIENKIETIKRPRKKLWHLSPASWWYLHCSPWSPAWWIFSCTPSLEPKWGNSHIADVWHTYHTAHCSTSQRTMLRRQTGEKQTKTSYQTVHTGTIKHTLKKQTKEPQICSCLQQ